MGRLSGFTADQVLSKLRRAGFVFDRQAKGSHEMGLAGYGLAGWRVRPLHGLRVRQLRWLRAREVAS